MISYSIEATRPTQHIFDIRLSFTAIQKNTAIQMPFWRPGRYEGGNFSKNIIGFNASANGEKLKFRKTTGNTWQVETPMRSRVEISYKLYAAELTAGNTYLDENFLLINPVNACMYVLELENQPVSINLKINSNWKVATAMLPGEDAEAGSWNFKCADLQELLDTPILASAKLTTLTYRVNDIPFYIDLYGEGIPNLEDFKAEFEKFTQTQIRAFGKFPVNRYHFLILLLPHKAYHGVEHETSTVIIIGPAANLGKHELYKELMGVSSHELYHTWNVKNLRPAEFTPYDFTRPTFSPLGYIVEGVTTYMGDRMLWQSGYFSNEEFFNELSTHIQRHLNNEGRFNLSLADSSVDTWVDGYGRGTPRRRVSIYVEGALVALTCDLEILKATQGKKTLNDVMKAMYQKYGNKKGYHEDDYWEELKAAAHLDWDTLKQELVYETGKLQNHLIRVLETVGLSLSANASSKSWERDLGMSVAKINGKYEVINVLENSPAEQAGVWFGDKILKVNDEPPVALFSGDGVETIKPTKFEIKSGFNHKTITVAPDGEVWMRRYKVVKKEDHHALFENWKGN